MDVFAWLRRRPRLTVALAAVAAVCIAAAVALAAEPAIKTITPKSADDITNLDVLKQQIRNYYGDPLGTGTFSSDSNYAKEACSVAAAGERWLKARSKVKSRAIVLDVDDTTLATWNYEVFSKWVFDFNSNQDFVVKQMFPAVPCMVDMVTKAAGEGYAVIFITGRGEGQETPTLGNLTKDDVPIDAGYPTPTTLNDGEDGLFTKPDVANYPQYLKDACASDPGGSCTTIHYKSATRAHIESLGYEIVANFGDQFSDLTGGSADRTFKMPNPNYFLP